VTTDPLEEKSNRNYPAQLCSRPKRRQSMNRTYLYGVLGSSIFVALVHIGFPPLPLAKLAEDGPANVLKTNKKILTDKYGNLPLAFEANAGQTSNQVKYISRGQGYTLFLTRHAEAVLVLGAAAAQRIPEAKAEPLSEPVKHRSESFPASVVRMKLINAKVTAEPEGLDDLPGKANYFIGNDPKKWSSNVPLFAKVKYRDIYPGVDLVYYGNQKQLEFDFIVAAGADPHSVALNFAGAKKLSFDEQGGLVVRIKGGKIRFGKPRIYQEIDGAQREIPGGYVLKNPHEVGFRVADYDVTKPLVIDPTLSYSTYLGGSIYGYGYGVAFDSAGSAYVTGETCASDFPTTPSAYQSVSPGYCPAFITKFDPTGSALLYSTYLGGSNYGSRGNGIAVDAAGNAYVAGSTSAPDFPVTPGAFQTNKAHGSSTPLSGPFGYTGFVTKLNPAGSALVYSTYLGGSTLDTAKDIALDAADNTYITGWTQSIDFPTTVGAVQPVFRGVPGSSANAFVTKLNASGTAPLLYSTYLGGSQSALGNAIAVDALGKAYVAGSAYFDFPVTPFAFQVQNQGGEDAFVAKIDPTGLGPASLVYATFLGGAANDSAEGIAVDAAGNAYVSGTTQSDNFPTTSGAFQAVKTSMPTLGSAFVTKLKPDGSALVYSTFLGGARYQFGTGIAVDASGSAYVTGTTNSYDFPTTPDAFQPNKGGYGACWWDAFVTAINPQGSALVYSTHVGGGIGAGSCGYGTDRGERIAVDAGGNVYVGGWTESTIFPTTPGAFQTAPVSTSTSGLPNAFVLKFSGFPTQP
jgi:Beta-propeller repeat